MWLDKVADILESFKQALVFSTPGAKRPREDAVPSDVHKEIRHVLKRPASNNNVNEKERIPVKSLRVEEANGNVPHGTKAYEWREFPSPSIKQVSGSDKVKFEREESPDDSLILKQQGVKFSSVQGGLQQPTTHGKGLGSLGAFQMTRTPQKEIVDPPSWLAEKSRDETRTRGLATSTEVTGNAFVGHRLSFARAQKLDEPLIETFKMPIENNYRLTESVGDEAFAAKLAYKKYMQRKEQLGVLASKAKTIISEKREKDFSEELKQLQEELKRFQALRKKKEEPELKEFQVTSTEQDEYRRLISRPPDDVLSSDPISNIEVKGRDMARLAPGVWLNDEIINFYISLLQQRDYRMRQTGTWPKCHFFNSFFYAKLNDKKDGYRYNNVRRWTLPARLKKSRQESSSILDCDLIIVPVNLSNTHWVCATIDLKNEQLAYYDSLGGEDENCLVNLANYVKDEFADKRGEQRDDVLKWPKLYPKDIPRQSNFSDCGVFTIIFANFLGKGKLQDFSPDAVEKFRVRVAMDIMRLTIE